MIAGPSSVSNPEKSELIDDFIAPSQEVTFTADQQVLSGREYNVIKHKIKSIKCRMNILKWSLIFKMFLC